ncbi:MAG TPA: helix-turn-helix transcriptional regulator [Actinomycetota bacterium]|nr:helix-turn-helix transcriptional regulator [Actinomycetota bacterium]
MMTRRPAIEIGRALREARRARGLTLKQAAERSQSRFRPTSIAGYERGERSITLERFIDLCRLYGMAPERLLAEIVRRLEGRPPVVVDLTKLEEIEAAEGRIVAGFVREVAALRGEPGRRTIALRAGDLEVLATAAGRRPEELAERIGAALREEERRREEVRRREEERRREEAPPAERGGAGPERAEGTASDRADPPGAPLVTSP